MVTLEIETERQEQAAREYGRRSSGRDQPGEVARTILQHSRGNARASVSATTNAMGLGKPALSRGGEVASDRFV